MGSIAENITKLTPTPANLLIPIRFDILEFDYTLIKSAIAPRSSRVTIQVKFSAPASAVAIQVQILRAQSPAENFKI